MTYKKQSAYKTISWTIKNDEIRQLLQRFCTFADAPQNFIRRVLAYEGIIRQKAAEMYSQVNFPQVEKTLKLSLYTEDAEMLRKAAKTSGLKVQELLERVLLHTEFEEAHK